MLPVAIDLSVLPLSGSDVIMLMRIDSSGQWVIGTYWYGHRVRRHSVDEGNVEECLFIPVADG